VTGRRDDPSYSVFAPITVGVQKGGIAAPPLTSFRMVSQRQQLNMSSWKRKRITNGLAGKNILQELQSFFEDDLIITGGIKIGYSGDLPVTSVFIKYSSIVI
jgi:hypothetical protein